MKQFEIEKDINVAYTKTGCSHCERAKELLKEKGIPYIEKDIVENKEYLDELMILMQDMLKPGDIITTPQIWFKGEYIGGTAQLENYLATKQAE